MTMLYSVWAATSICVPASLARARATQSAAADCGVHRAVDDNEIDTM